jgi:phage gp36-like protein
MVHCKCEPTHYVECFEYAGNNKKRRYFDQCIFLETITDGRVKIQIINGKKGGSGIRYVSKSRLIDMYCRVK